MTSFTYNPHEYSIFVGIDVHKESFSFTVKDKNAMNICKTIPAHAEELYDYLIKRFSHERIICTYEAGPTGFNLHDYFWTKHIPCLVVSPLSIPTAPNDKVKTDKRDSKKLAQQLRSGDIMGIRVPEGHYRDLRHLVRIREEQSEQVTHTKQKIKGLLLYEWLHPHLSDEKDYWSSRYIERLKTLPTTPAVQIRLDHLIRNLRYFREQLTQATKELRQFTRLHEGIHRNIQYLCSIPGIGFTTAVTLLGNIGDPMLLRNPRELGAFIGVVPSEHSTGKHEEKGSITHLGNSKLRAVLIEAAWTSMRKNPALRQYFHRIRSKNPTGVGSRKAMVAVARKLTLIIYRILKDQRMYHL